MRAAQAEQTLPGQVAGPGFLVLALELAWKGALGLVIMVCGSCLLATANCSC